MATTPEELVPDNTGASGRSVKTLKASRALDEIAGLRGVLFQRSFPE
jgi:hypothetical protein